MITEIMYNPPESFVDTLEFIELHNPTSSSISLNGYSFTQGISHTFGAVSISAGGYLVIAKRPSAILSGYGVNAIQWNSGVLSNSGEVIVLKDNYGILGVALSMLAARFLQNAISYLIAKSQVRKIS